MPKKKPKRKSKTMFESLKKGQLVHDVWYGNGKVTKKLKGRAFIYLFSKRETWSYDDTHVNHFIRKGRAKNENR